MHINRKTSKRLIYFFQIDVGSLMYFWGLTIDTVTTVCLILAIGLAVDYSAHIGHSFMTVTGSRNGIFQLFTHLQND